MTSSREAAKATCAIAVPNSSAGTRPLVPETSGDRRVLLDRHGGEGEPRGSAAHGDAAVLLDRDLDRRVGQTARDVGQQPPVHEDRAGLVDGRSMVVRAEAS